MHYEGKFEEKNYFKTVTLSSIRKYFSNINTGI